MQGLLLNHRSRMGHTQKPLAKRGGCIAVGQSQKPLVKRGKKLLGTKHTRSDAASQTTQLLTQLKSCFSNRFARFETQ